MPKETITVTIEAGNVLELDKVKKAVEAVAKLGADDAGRIEQICKKPSALKALKDKWAFLKAMF